MTTQHILYTCVQHVYTCKYIAFMCTCVDRDTYRAYEALVPGSGSFVLLTHLIIPSYRGRK
jgi:hypothetical protein